MWYALARLAAYPDDRTLVDARAMLAAAHSTAGSVAAREFLEVTAPMTAAELQEEYTASFDFDPACALDLGWHLFGESRERGAFLAALREDLQAAGIPESHELPDHLTHVLALVARDGYARATQLADLVMPAVGAIERALTKRGSPYAHVLAAVYAELAALVDRAIVHR
jgi:nitrate reductase delta subunit